MKKQIKMAHKSIENLCGKRFSEKMKDHYSDEDLDILLAIDQKIKVIQESGKAEHFGDYFLIKKDDVDWLVDFSKILTHYCKFAQLKKKPINNSLKGFSFELGDFKSYLPATNIELFETLLRKGREKKAYAYVPEEKDSEYLFIILKISGQDDLYFIFRECSEHVVLEEAFKRKDAILEPFEYHVVGALESALCKHLGLKLLAEDPMDFEAETLFKKFESLLG